MKRIGKRGHSKIDKTSFIAQLAKEAIVVSHDEIKPGKMVSDQSFVKCKSVEVDQTGRIKPGMIVANIFVAAWAYCLRLDKPGLHTSSHPQN